MLENFKERRNYGKLRRLEEKVENLRKDVAFARQEKQHQVYVNLGIKIMEVESQIRLLRQKLGIYCD